VSILASSQRRSNTPRPLPPADLIKTLEGEILRLTGFANRYSQVKWVWLTFGEGGSKALEFAASLSLAAPSR
jgi:hypothetical protein